MRILVTGANGFIGRNLIAHLDEIDSVSILKFTRDNAQHELVKMVSSSDAVVHLAGINRPKNDAEFTEGNYQLTNVLCEALKANGENIPVIFASSIQAELDNEYGKSKHEAEETLKKYSASTGNDVYIYRLANVFGKWCRQNYNSVVATFCHNIANDLPIQINVPSAELNLVYIDDVINEFIAVLLKNKRSSAPDIYPLYPIKLGELADQIKAFRNSRNTLLTEKVGVGLTRALYATYISYLKPSMFSYKLEKHEDQRGVFVEMLKTHDSGQFSYFTAKPGITRGGHYHHTKSEKFLVISGSARFRFRNVDTGDEYSLDVRGDSPEVVETIPGWAHDITNTGDTELVVMLWANEAFDKLNPDTYASRLI